MLPTLPDSFEIGRGAGGGDDFFQAAVQCLKHLKPGEVCSVKTLRLACKRYAITQQEEVRSWLNEALHYGTELSNIEDYMKYVEVSSKDLTPQKAVWLKLEKTILGRPEIEGRMICSIYNVRLHVLEKYTFDDNQNLDHMQDKSSRDDQQFGSCYADKSDNNENEIWKSKLVDKCGCNYVEKVDYDAKDTIHVLQHDKHIFQPILKTNSGNDSTDASDDDEVESSLAYNLRIVVQSTKPTEAKLNLIRQLLEKGADINFQDCNDKGNTILHIAMRKKDLRIINLLVENGADIQIKNKNGKSALQYAKIMKCPQIIDILRGKWDCLNINENKHEQDVQRTINTNKSNELDEIPNRLKFRRRSDDDGASGQRYEVNLLILFKLRAEHLTNGFYLGCNLEEAEAFDDVVFKYWDKNGSRTIFLQAKHKRNPTHHQISFKTFSEDKDFYLEKYFKSYLKIRDSYKEKISNLVFEEGFGNAKYDFVILTNAILDERCDSFIFPDVAVFNFPIGFGGKVMKLKPECAIDYLTNKECTEYISLVSKTFVEFLSKANKYGMMESNELVKEYHVLWAQRVLKDKDVVDDNNNGSSQKKEIKYRNVEFREDFLNGTSKDKLFSQFQNDVRNNTQFQKIPKEQLQVPVQFGNVDPTLHLSHSVDKFCEKFVQLITDNFSSHVCKINDISDRKFLKDICKLVGRVLILNSISGFLRLNDATLEGESKHLRDSLLNAMTSAGFDHQMEFDFQIKCFPKLTLSYLSKNEADILDFNNKLYFFTGQPSVNGMDELIKQELKDVYKLTNDEVYQSYLRISDKMTKYWMQTDKVAFLRKGDRFFSDILKNGIHFRVRYPVPSFTGRVEQLKSLHEYLQKDQIAVISPLVAISGLGGIGKSELARKYAAIYGSCYDDNVIWINAETVATASYSFRTLCLDALNIPVLNEDGRERDIKLIVKDVYGFFRKRRSLFIFDNATSLKNLRYDDENGIKKFLPKRLTPDMYNPCVIITSRNENWRTENIISLHTFSDEEAIAFVKTFLKINDDSEDDDIKKLIKLLQNFPLALQQAVSYIRENADPRFNTKEFRIADYLQLYNEQNRVLLNFKFPEDSMDLYTTTTYKTWNISFDNIQHLKFGKEAITMMSLFAYLDPNGFDIEFVSAAMQIKNEAFRNGINLLKQYSLITLDDGMVSIHRLVQEVTRINLKDQQIEKGALTVALSLVRRHTEKKHIVQGMSVWNFAKHNQDLVREFNLIPCKIAQALQDSARYEEAYSLSKDSSILLHALLGPDHEGTLSNQNVVCQLLDWQGRYKEALASYEEMYERLCKIIGPEHVAAWNTKDNIANVLANQGRYDEALSIYVDMFEKRANAFGPDDPDTLKTQFSIADVLSQQGKQDEALRMYLELFVKQCNIIGSDHPSALTTQNNIALLLSELGKHDEALKSYSDILEKQNNIIGPDNPSTLTTKHNVALTLTKLGKYDDALEIFMEVFDKQNTIFGPDNPSTLTTQYSIASALSDQGKIDKALEMYFEILEKENHIHGPDNPSTLTTQNNIALLYSEMGRDVEALTLFSGILEKQNKTVGPNNPFTLTTQHNIAFAMSNQGKYEEALQWYFKTFARKVELLGPENPSTLVTEHHIANVFLHQGKYEEALTAHLEVFDKNNKILGPDNPSTLKIQHDIAYTLSKQGRYDDALTTYLKVFEKHSEVLGSDNPDTLAIQNKIADVLADQGKYDEALKNYEQVFDKYTNILGTDHPSTLTTQHNIANLLKQLGLHDKALKSYFEVFDKQVKILGPHNPNTLQTQFSIASVLCEQGSHDEALRMYLEVLDLEQKILGPDNPITLTTQHEIAFVLSQQGKCEDALNSYLKVFEKQSEIFGPENPDTLTTEYNIAYVLSEQGKHNEALRIFKENFEKKKRILGPDNPSTLSSRGNIAQQLFYLGKDDEALNIFSEVYEKQVEILGDQHPTTLLTAGNIAHLLSKRGKHDNA